MIIAIAISAIIATMAYESFEGASRNAGRTKEVLIDINKLDRAWQLIGQDMRNIIQPNPQQPNSQVILQAVSLSSKGKNAFQVIMRFSRRGWVNPMGRVRSDLQQVNYRLAEGKLIRDYLPERNKKLEDIDFEREALHQTLLEKVTDVQVRFLSEGYIAANGKSALEGEGYSKNWEPTWPPLNAAGSPGLLVAVEITIEIEGVGRSARLYELPQ